MNKRIIIEYWWKCPKIKGKLPVSLQDALKESASERINEMMRQGFVSGELNDNVMIKLEGKRTPKDGWECHGWWTAIKEDI